MIRKPCKVYSAIVMIGIGATGASGSVFAAAPPPIRLAADNRVPACVTPARLDAFLSAQIGRRGYRVHPPHRNIAKWYRHHGESQRVRWDYAFFQMALETNFLSFRRSDGRRGDVLPTQNNFAGLGTTGGGVRGDSYPDASTGVLAQIQHLVVYSGQRLDRPTGHRTRLKQNVILRSVSKIARRRPVTFTDLAGRWAADRRYASSIQRLANRFYKQYCGDQVIDSNHTKAPRARRAPARLIPTTTTSGNRTTGSVVRKVLQVAGTRKITESAYVARPRAKPKATVAPQAFRPSGKAAGPQIPDTQSFVPAATALPRPTAHAAIKPGLTPGVNPAPGTTTPCRVQTAGYGGARAVLIKSASGSTIKLTALNVYPGFENMMAQSFIKSHASDGVTIGVYPSRKAAVAEAHALCRQRGAKANK